MGGSRPAYDGWILAGRERAMPSRSIADVAAIAASVGAFHLAFPGGPAAWLAWIAVVPLGLALHGRSARDAFSLTFAAAFFGWWVSTWWAVPALALASNADPDLLWPLHAAACALYAIPYALAGVLHVRMAWNANGWGALRAATVWTALCSPSFAILPGNLAHSQFRATSVIQIVDLAGVPALFFVMHWFGFLLVAAMVQRADRRRAVGTVALALAVLASVVSYGNLRSAEVQRRTSAPGVTQVEVGLVQPNLSLQRRRREDRAIALNRLTRLTDQLLDAPHPPELIIWPEIPVPLSYVQYPEDRRALDTLAATRGISLLAGAFAPHGRLVGAYYNASHLLSPGRPTQTYTKRRLLPFAEYLPGEQRFPWMHRLFPNALRYQPGESETVLDTRSGIGLIPLICYEAVFAELAIAGVQAGGNLIVNTTNDAWLGVGRGAQAHLALAMFRAVETRTPMVRVANSGISAVVEASGEISAVSPQFRATTLRHTVRLPHIETWYQRGGKHFAWICLALTAGLVLRGLLRRQS